MNGYLSTRLWLLFVGIWLHGLSLAQAQEYDMFAAQHPPFATLTLLAEEWDTQSLEWDSLISALETVGLQPFETTESPANLLTDNMAPIFSATAEEGGEGFAVYRLPVENSQRVMWDWIGRNNGLSTSDRFLGAKDSTVRFALARDSLLLLYSQWVGFDTRLLASYPNRLSGWHTLEYERALGRLDTVLRVVARHLIPTPYAMYAAGPDGSLTEAQRQYGLVKFWSEVKQNFAFFEQVPGLDWDATLLEFFPTVTAARSTAEYYRELERLAALLEDGHTSIYLPGNVRRTTAKPPIQLKFIEHRPVVVNVETAFAERMPVGSIVTHVNGMEVNRFLADSIYPFVAAGNEHARRTLAIRRLLDAPTGSNTAIQFVTPNGETRRQKLIARTNRNIDWSIPEAQWTPASFKMLDEKTGYLALNTFSYGSVVDTFQRYRPRIADCDQLVIDLRENGGGNSAYGYEILKHFSTEPLLTPSWRTRESRASDRAFGQHYSQQAELPDGAEYERYVQTYQDGYWYEESPDTIQPADTVYPIPVAVLVSNWTASSAENFLVAADALRNFTFVGERSFGSTGQPLFIDLPGGGGARICTKYNTYPDGREYVGPGIKVDTEVQPTLADHLSGKDIILEKALDILKGG